MFITFFVLLTFFFLGGLFTPAQSMPAWAQTVAEFNPIKHFVSLLRAVLMKGSRLAEVADALAKMGLFAAVVLGIALVRYRKTAS
jgi:ABC-2 type transport system permease protein